MVQPGCHMSMRCYSDDGVYIWLSTPSPLPVEGDVLMSAGTCHMPKTFGCPLPSSGDSAGRGSVFVDARLPPQHQVGNHCNTWSPIETSKFFIVSYCNTYRSLWELFSTFWGTLINHIPWRTQRGTEGIVLLMESAESVREWTRKWLTIGKWWFNLHYWKVNLVGGRVQINQQTQDHAPIKTMYTEKTWWTTTMRIHGDNISSIAASCAIRLCLLAMHFENWTWGTTKLIDMLYSCSNRDGRRIGSSFANTFVPKGTNHKNI
jgi:hypothetical protein